MSVYTITCVPNNRVYVGQSVDAKKRFKQHARQPPHRMREDAMQYQPWESHFVLDIVQTVRSEHANNAERALVAKFDSTGPSGYNTVKGSPTSSRQWWALKRKGAFDK